MNAREARGMPSIADLRPNGKQWAHGIVAGAIVLEATMLANLAPNRAAISEAQSSLVQRLKGEFQIEPRTMNNKAGPIYPFRAVAHLWAASGIFYQGGDRAFPCPLDRLGEFLATAEAIRNLAERSRAKRSPSTVMRAGEAVRLSDDILAALPAVSLPNYKLRSCPD